VPEATPGPVPEEASEKEEETVTGEEEEEEEEEGEEEEEAAPIVPVAIRPAQVRTGGQPSLCWKYYTRVVVGSRRTKKGNEVDKVEARCKLCTMG
jgi:hypothetical protein